MKRSRLTGERRPTGRLGWNRTQADVAEAAIHYQILAEVNELRIRRKERPYEELADVPPEELPGSVCLRCYRGIWTGGIGAYINPADGKRTTAGFPHQTRILVGHICDECREQAKATDAADRERKAAHASLRSAGRTPPRLRVRTASPSDPASQGRPRGPRVSG